MKWRLLKEKNEVWDIEEIRPEGEEPEDAGENDDE